MIKNRTMAVTIINYWIVPFSLVAIAVFASANTTRQSEMADLARRATRWVGTLSDGNVHVKFHDDRLRNILKFHGNTFRWPTTLTFDLKFWKYLSVTKYPYSMCMLSFMMIGWEMTENYYTLKFCENTDKHTNTQTHKQLQTWALQYLALPLWGAR